jgi:antitoxin (DNA-binding transcriptional repressor) of toxin-antitoxin stability system
MLISVDCFVYGGFYRHIKIAEEVEILDGKTPVARLIHVSKSARNKAEASWIKEMEALGIVVRPRHQGYSREFLAEKSLPVAGKPGVLDALLGERKGRL